MTTTFDLWQQFLVAEPADAAQYLGWHADGCPGVQNEGLLKALAWAKSAGKVTHEEWTNLVTDLWRSVYGWPEADEEGEAYE